MELQCRLFSPREAHFCSHPSAASTASAGSRLEIRNSSGGVHAHCRRTSCVAVCRLRGRSEKRFGKLCSVIVSGRSSRGFCWSGVGIHSFLRQRGRRKSVDRSRGICDANSSSSTIDVDASEGESQTARLEEDIITRILREKPCQLEQKYKVGNEFYTLREKLQLETPFWRKFLNSVRVNESSSRVNATQELPQNDGDSRDGDEQVVGDSQFEDTQSADKPKEGEEPSLSEKGSTSPIYLADLLRQFKGELYVPEEALENRISELGTFNKNLESLPEMTLEDFWKFLTADQVKLLTSRGEPTLRGGFVYWDFVVELKDIPGVKQLHRTKWAMHLSEEEAEIVLQDYKGPQREIETSFTPYVLRPPSVPHPIASSISARLVVEAGVFVSILSALVATTGAVIARIVLSAAGVAKFTVVNIAWPLVRPIWRPIFGLFVYIVGGIWTGLVAVISGKKGPGWFISEGYRMWKSGDLVSSARTLGAIIFVLVAMAALAKFTLTRRPKDFTKWDLWQAIEFGHSKPQARVEGTTGIGFSDVAGIDDVVKELQELVSYLKDPERFNRMGTKPPHGVLMEGPPGCGKTLLAKAIAGEAGVPFYQMAGSEFVEVLVGVGAARVRDLLKEPSRHGAAGEEGMESYNAGAQERETTLNQLLIELDGFDTGKGVVFLGATNRMDMLDPALLRPGRFDRKIAIRAPKAKGRYDILKVHAKSVNLDPSIDLWVYAKNLPGWSGAELAQFLQEAALVAVRRGGSIIERHDMDQALDRLTMGPERLGVERRQPVHRRMATHEVGLAMTSHLLRRLEDAKVEFCDRVSIVPRGKTLARTIFDRLDDEDYLFERRPTLIHRMQVMLGGRAAEEVLYGRDTSSYSVRHLADASWLARKMVSVWNLEGEITIPGDSCPWARQPSFTGPSLGFEGGLYDNYGFNEHILNYDMVNEVADRTKSLLDGTYMRTLEMLKQHQAALAKAVYVVMEKEELFGDELEIILDHYPAGTPVQSVEAEDEPGLLPRKVETYEISAGVSEREGLEGETLTLPEPQDNRFDSWVLASRKTDTEEVGERIVETKSVSEKRADIQSTTPNGTVESRKKTDGSIDRGGSLLEEGDVAATNRSASGHLFVEPSSVDASTPASVRTGGWMGCPRQDATLAAVTESPSLGLHRNLPGRWHTIRPPS